MAALGKTNRPIARSRVIPDTPLLLPTLAFAAALSALGMIGMLARRNPVVWGLSAGIAGQGLLLSFVAFASRSADSSHGSAGIWMLIAIVIEMGVIGLFATSLGRMSASDREQGGEPGTGDGAVAPPDACKPLDSPDGHPVLEREQP